MKKPDNPPDDLAKIREQIIGLGEKSFRKSYYPELQEKLADLERFKTFLDQSNDAIFLAEIPSGNLLYVSKSVCEQTGYTEEECCSLTIYDIVHENTGKLDAILSGKTESISFEANLRKRSGEKTPYDLNIHGVTFKNREYVVAIARDITERKRAEETLRESEEKFRALLESSTAAIIVYQGEWLVSVNPATERITGYSMEELLKMRTIDVIHPDFKEMVRQRALARQRGEPAPAQYEAKIVTKSGEDRWVLISVGPITYLGKPAGVATLLDITDRKLAEESLRLTQFALDKFSDSAIWISPQGRIVYVNETTCKRLGYSKDELLAMHIWDVDRDYGPARYAEIWERMKQEGGTLKFESQHTARDGSRFPVEVTCSYICYSEKEYMISFDRDITERKRAEEALRESEEMFRALAESARAEIVLIKGNRFIYVNPERIRALGYTKEELLKMNVEDTIHPEMREMVRDRVRRRLLGEPVPSRYEVKMITKSGEIYWEEISSTLIDYKGEPTILSMSLNMTARKRAEMAMKEAKMQAELYLDLMSHDITNMNQALMGNLEMLEMLSETGEIDRGLIDSSIKIINRSSRMISDVKKLTQVQTGKDPIREMDVREVLEAVKARYSMVPGRQITINYPPGACCMVRADDLLGDVFDNLMDNAITHSTGPVTVDLTVDKIRIEGRWYCQVTVADTGPGIPDDLKKNIFLTIEEIEAGEKLKRRGFGLFLVRTLTDHYHGKVWVEDRIPGDYTKGAKFVVMLPAVEK